MTQKFLFQVDDVNIPFLTAKGDVSEQARAYLTKTKKYKLSERKYLEITEKKNEKGEVTGYVVKDAKKKRTFTAKQVIKDNVPIWSLSVSEKEKVQKDPRLLTSKSASKFERETVLTPLTTELKNIGYSPKRIKTLKDQAFKKTRADLNDCYVDSDSCFVDNFVNKRLEPVKKKILEIAGIPITATGKAGKGASR